MTTKRIDTAGHLVIPEAYVTTPAFDRWWTTQDGGRTLTFRPTGQRYALVAHQASLFVYDCLDKPVIVPHVTVAPLGPRVSPLKDR